MADTGPNQSLVHSTRVLPVEAESLSTGLDVGLHSLPQQVMNFTYDSVTSDCAIYHTTLERSEVQYPQ